MTQYCGFMFWADLWNHCTPSFKNSFFFFLDPFHGFLQYRCSLIHWMTVGGMKRFIHGECLHHLPLKSSRKDPCALSCLRRAVYKHFQSYFFILTWILHKTQHQREVCQNVKRLNRMVIQTSASHTIFMFSSLPQQSSSECYVFSCTIRAFGYGLSFHFKFVQHISPMCPSLALFDPWQLH